MTDRAASIAAATSYLDALVAHDGAVAQIVERFRVVEGGITEIEAVFLVHRDPAWRGWTPSPATDS